MNYGCGSFGKELPENEKHWWMDGMIYKNQHNQIEIISRLSQFSNPTSCFVIKLAIASRMVAASFTPIFAESKNATCGLKQYYNDTPLACNFLSTFEVNMLTSPELAKPFDDFVEQSFKYQLENNLLSNLDNEDLAKLEKQNKNKILSLIHNLISKCPINSDFEKKDNNEKNQSYMSEFLNEFVVSKISFWIFSNCSFNCS